MNPPDIELDILAIGPHPDDIEFCCGGTIISLAQKGYKVGVIDMTQGEKGSRGTVDDRTKEADRAAKVMGLAVRENLHIPDGAVGTTQPDEDPQLHVKRVVWALRRFRPKLVFLPYWKCRHPDHPAASKVISNAIFYAGAPKFVGKDLWSKEVTQESHTCLQSIYYQMRHKFDPSFIVDISDTYERKVEAIKCHHSQIHRDGDENLPNTLVSSRIMGPALEARDRLYGAMIGKPYGEPFLTNNAIPIADPLEHFVNQGSKSVLYFKS